MPDRLELATGQVGLDGFVVGVGKLIPAVRQYHQPVVDVAMSDVVAIVKTERQHLAVVAIDHRGDESWRDIQVDPSLVEVTPLSSDGIDRGDLVLIRFLMKGKFDE